MFILHESIFLMDCSQFEVLFYSHVLQFLVAITTSFWSSWWIVIIVLIPTYIFNSQHSQGWICYMLISRPWLHILVTIIVCQRFGQPRYLRSMMQNLSPTTSNAGLISLPLDF